MIEQTTLKRRVLDNRQWAGCRILDSLANLPEVLPWGFSGPPRTYCCSLGPLGMSIDKRCLPYDATPQFAVLTGRRHRQRSIGLFSELMTLTK